MMATLVPLRPSQLNFTVRRFLGLVPAAAPKTDGDWPMPVAEFIQRDTLAFSDIVMTRKEYNFMSWLIRVATKSNFAHVALVFLVPQWQHGWQSTFLIESVFSGTEVTDLSEYFKHKRLAIAVKRLNRPWFTEEVGRRVRGRMLDDIKAEYAFSTLIGLGRQLLFGVEGAVRGHKRAVARRQESGSAAPKEYICSGFMQMGFVRGVMEFIREGKVPAEALRDVIFDKNLARMLPIDWSEFTRAEQIDILDEFIKAFEDQLMAVTPLDIETSGAFEWAYVAKDGLVHPVKTYEDVCRIMGIRPLET
jgi:hypothetical protein